ncbi:hypothetical protein PENCOP_c002G03791 [Penicillium coprophilum]|uniref:Aminoglycoside phosphotransferase domain-containing protein n=1 Tax=Penicillium coprophilum TaxID=36646 RepID=A0A1V6V2I1_9EURO|nr:hypothetical protein PENCOP_c002G03791 [Penicillium coprophilum]
MLPQDEDELTEDHTNEDITILLLSEVASMNFVRSKTTIPVPRVYGHSAAKNAFGHPYILMEALPGTVLNNRMALSIPTTHKRRFAVQLAGYIYELSPLQFSKIGCLLYTEPKNLEISPFHMSSFWIKPLSPSLEYFYLSRKAQTEEILSEHPGEKDWGAAAWFLEKSLTSMVMEEYIYGPFPLCHLDLYYNNILVEKDFNITAVLDWSNVQTVPVERFVVNPEFVAPPAAPQEYTQAVFKFRDIFVEELTRIERDKKDESDRGGWSCLVCLDRLWPRLFFDVPVVLRGALFLMLSLLWL